MRRLPSASSLDESLSVVCSWFSIREKTYEPDDRLRQSVVEVERVLLSVAIAIIQPSFDGGPSRRAVAQQSPVQAAIDGLVNALTDPDPGVRRNAAIALGELRSARAVPALIAASWDGNDEVRSRASAALRQIEEANPAIVVTDALRGMDGRIGRAAANALPGVGRAFGIEFARLSPQSSVVSRRSQSAVRVDSQQSAVSSPLHRRRSAALHWRLRTSDCGLATADWRQPTDDWDCRLRPTTGRLTTAD